MRSTGWVAMAAVTWAALVLLAPQEALACATCYGYGASDSPMVDGMNMAILTLIACVGLVYIGVGKVVWDIRRRTRRLQHRDARFRVIQGGRR